MDDNRYKHRLNLQMRFKDIDLFGHVNNNVYFEYFDLGKVKYIEDTLGDLFNPKGDAAVVANINCNFLHPTLPNEPLAVETRTDSMGDHSFTLNQRVLNTNTGEVKCEGSVVMVCFDTRTGKSRELPDEWRKRIDRFEAMHDA